MATDRKDWTTDWLKPHRLQPKTAEEYAQASTIEGLIERLERHQLYSGLVGSCFRLARAMKLNREQTFALLAYHAVIQTEQAFDRELERLSTEPQPPIILRETGRNRPAAK